MIFFFDKIKKKIILKRHRGSNSMRLLIIDQNVNSINDLIEDLSKSQKSFDITCAEDCIEALSSIQEGPEFDLIVSDFKLPKMDGISLLQTLRENKFTTQFILFSKEPPKNISSLKNSLQLSGWFHKSFNRDMRLDSTQLIRILEKFSDKITALEQYESLKS